MDDLSPDLKQKLSVQMFEETARQNESLMASIAQKVDEFKMFSMSSSTKDETATQRRVI